MSSLYIIDYSIYYHTTVGEATGMLNKGGGKMMEEERRRRPRRAASRRQKSWATQVDSEGETFSSGSGTGGRSGPPPARQGDTQGGPPD